MLPRVRHLNIDFLSAFQLQPQACASSTALVEEPPVSGGVCACLYLELLHGRHVVAEHAIFQHGNGVTLGAYFLNLVTSAVAAEVTQEPESMFHTLLKSRLRVSARPSEKSHHSNR